LWQPPDTGTDDIVHLAPVRELVDFLIFTIFPVGYFHSYSL
jgi:hypothetical protein